MKSRVQLIWNRVHQVPPGYSSEALPKEIMDRIRELLKLEDELDVVADAFIKEENERRKARWVEYLRNEEWRCRR